MDDNVVSGDGVKRRLPPWMLGTQALNKSETVRLNNGDDDEGSRAGKERMKKRGRKPKLTSCEIGNDDDDEGSRADEERMKRRGRRPKPKTCEIGNDNDDDDDEEGSRTDERMKKHDRRHKPKSCEIGNDDDDEGSREAEERMKKRRRRPKLKSCDIGNYDDDGDLNLEEESTGVLRRCQVRKQTRREMISQDVDVDGEVAMDKKKRKGKAKKTPEVDSSAVSGGPVENGEDEELTVEDLMSIAKEFVQEDEDVHSVLSIKHGKRDEDARSQHIKSGSSLGTPQGNIRSFQDRGTSSSSTEVENPTGEAPISADPTQDMLDLFLGPLLKKTQEDKGRMPLTEEINFAREARKRPYSATLGEEPAVVVKKKTSFKDKVAMFLD